MMSETMLRQKDITEKKKIPKSTIYYNINNGDFPKPIKKGRSSYWLESEVDEWLTNESPTRAD